MFNSMSLTGGLDMHHYPGRYKSSVPPEGRKVVFLDDNGYDIEREHARELLAKPSKPLPVIKGEAAKRIAQKLNKKKKGDKACFRTK